MQSKAATVDEYIKSLPDDRRDAIQAIRAVFKKNLDKGFEEGMSYGMIGYYVPHSIYPAGYHCDPKQPLPFAGIASQKNAISIYLMSVYMQKDGAKRFVNAWKKTGKKLDMGKSCIRAKTIDGFALDVVGDTLRQISAREYIDLYESNLNSNGKPTSTKKPAPKKAVAKKK